MWLLGLAGEKDFEALEASSAVDSKSFDESGFHVLRTARQYLFVDFGPVGFKGLGGHGHNDCLSFEWHVDERPLLTDSGAYVYTPSVEWRNLFRSTAFHNTIRIDGQEINRFFSSQALWSLPGRRPPTRGREEIRGGLGGARGWA